MVSPLLCPAEGPPDARGAATVTVRLSSDVLFAFGSAELSPAARTAIDALGAQIGGNGGTVTIEGHTDAVGSDAGPEPARGDPHRRPVPGACGDARALTDDLSKAGLTPQLRGLERHGGHLLAQVVVSNPTTAAIPLEAGSGLIPDRSEPLGITLADRTTQRRHQLCRVPSRQYAFFRLGNPGNEYSLDSSGSVPAGAEVTFWAFFAPPATGVRTVDVELGGFGRAVATPVPG